MSNRYEMMHPNRTMELRDTLAEAGIHIPAPDIDGFIEGSRLTVGYATGSNPELEYDGAWEYTLPEVLLYIAQDYGIPLSTLYKIDYGTATL